MFTAGGEERLSCPRGAGVTPRRGVGGVQLQVVEGCIGDRWIRIGQGGPAWELFRGQLVLEDVCHHLLVAGFVDSLTAEKHLQFGYPVEHLLASRPVGPSCAMEVLESLSGAIQLAVC